MGKGSAGESAAGNRKYGAKYMMHHVMLVLERDQLKNVLRVKVTDVRPRGNFMVTFE